MNSAHWRCQVCEKPIQPGDGRVDIINLDEEAAAVGAYPQHRTPEPRGRDETVDLADLKDDIMQMMTPSVGARVHHSGCDPYPEGDGYGIDLRAAQTLEEWVGWISHLREKTWLSKRDLVRILAFWWTHKGERVPNP